MSDPAHKRRWFRWSLRTMFALTILAAILCWGFLSLPLKLTEAERVYFSSSDEAIDAMAGSVPGFENVIGGGSEFQGSTHRPGESKEVHYLDVERTRWNPKPIAPALALVGFLGCWLASFWFRAACTH
jgi:hypothetical protein